MNDKNTIMKIIKEDIEKYLSEQTSYKESLRTPSSNIISDNE